MHIDIRSCVLFEKALRYLTDLVGADLSGRQRPESDD
jgi:hypothetical protein